MDKETKGAWIVHHARKIAMDVAAPAEYSVIDEAGKAAELLMRLGATGESTLKNEEVIAVAKAANLNVRTELPHYVQLLKDKRLVDTSSAEMQVLGVTTRGVLTHASDIFDDAAPTAQEIAAVELGEVASTAPVSLSEAKTYISDNYRMESRLVDDFLRRSCEIGFVDIEGDDPSNKLLFNGNLFKRDNVQKASKVLGSLSTAEQQALAEVNELLHSTGCVLEKTCEKRLGAQLLAKLKAAGVLELNIVSNENGEHPFITLPGAFHKYVNPLIDDSFDMAKALVSALTYGVQLRKAQDGRIVSVAWILNALIDGRTIGPSTAIGADYRVLEENRVVKLTYAYGTQYHMKLLKKEVGELARAVLRRGDANSETFSAIPNVPMSGYTGPERAREALRKRQSKPSKQQTHDILSVLRGQRGL